VFAASARFVDGDFQYLSDGNSGSRVVPQAVAESADAHYQVLLDSTHGWHEGTADPWPWLGYFTRVIAGAYAVFADRAAAAQTPGTKQQRVREHILRHAPVTFRLADIRTAVPGVSDQTIRLVLEQLRNEGKVRADGTGRSATWTRTNTARSEQLPCASSPNSAGAGEQGPDARTCRAGPPQPAAGPAAKTPLSGLRLQGRTGRADRAAHAA